MNKYKVVKKINEYDASVYYVIKKRLLFFFWDNVGKDYGLFSVKVKHYGTKEDAEEHISKLLNLQTS